MLCDNCIYNKSLSDVASYCENTFSALHTLLEHNIKNFVWLTDDFECDQYTPKLNLKNRITSLS